MPHYTAGLNHEATLVALRQQAEDARRAEVERAVRFLARGGRPAEVIDWLSQRLTNKLLHAPMQALNGCHAAEKAP